MIIQPYTTCQTLTLTQRESELNLLLSRGELVVLLVLVIVTVILVVVLHLLVIVVNLTTVRKVGPSADAMRRVVHASLAYGLRAACREVWLTTVRDDHGETIRLVRAEAISAPDADCGMRKADGAVAKRTTVELDEMPPAPPDGLYDLLERLVEPLGRVRLRKLE